jgi:hypothetical protein
MAARHHHVGAVRKDADRATEMLVGLVADTVLMRPKEQRRQRQDADDDCASAR